jgi:predicted TPR repeat methyltransferase
MTRNDFEEAERYFKKALNKIKSRDFAAAESYYKRALRHNPGHLDANYLLGTLYAEQRDLPKALKFLRQAETINPHSQMVLNNLGNIYQMSREFDKAVDCYQRALSVQENMPEVYNNLGNIYKQQEHLAEAEQCYRRALELKPDMVQTYCNLGEVLRSQQNPAAGVECYRKAIELAPDYKTAHEGLGVCYVAMGEREQAIACFKRCLELAPNDTGEVQLRLARLHAGDMPERYPAAVMLSTYEKKAQNWDSDIQRPGREFLGPQNVRNMLEQLQLPQTGMLDVLDIGCGTGACGEYLRHYAKRLIGVDLSAPMLAQAQKKNFYTQLECADALGFMQQSRQQFDLLVASGVLILFGDLLPIFQAAEKLLKPDGVFVFTLYRSESEPIEVRHNLHFAHSESYIVQTAQTAKLQVQLLEKHVHEYDAEVPQAGWMVTLRKTG